MVDEKLGDDTLYGSDLEDSFNAVFSKNGQWIWPEETPEWAGGKEGEADFYNALRDAWIVSDIPLKRRLVAEHGGPKEWASLVNDNDFTVRAAVAKFGDSTCHQCLYTDPSSFVREYVANYANPQILYSMAKIEQDPEVIVRIARRGYPEVKHELVKTCWDKPEILCRISPYLGIKDNDLLLSHTDPQVRLSVAKSGTRRQLKQVLSDPEIPDIQKVFVEWKLEDLEDVASALVPSRIKEQYRTQGAEL